MKFEGDRGSAFFRSTLVQTLFYGVFSAWVLWARQTPTPTGPFNWHDAVWHLRAPVLRALFQQLSDPGRLQPLGLVEVLDWTAAALNRVDRDAFFAKFGEGEAVPYFYEPFLQAFDPDLRKQLGVWYTPAEVVRYMVARVDKALKDDLEKLAGNRPDYGEGLYSGQSRLAEQGNAGEAFGPKGPVGKRTGCIWTTWARTPSTVLLASLRGQLFSDDDFAEIYCPDNGRDSVPPSLLATALLLQTYDKVSDAEAKARADFDIRWKVALGIEIEDRPFAKSTLQMFRAQLILHDKVREVFEGSLRLARQSGYLKKRGMRVALDTTYILGRGAVKDTYNLLADGIVKLLRVLAAVANATLPEWAEGQGYERYFGSSIKGEATIDWSDRKARRKLLGEIVADADRLLELARQAWLELPEDSGQRQSIVDGAELLGQLLLQDVERKERRWRCRC